MDAMTRANTKKYLVKLLKVDDTPSPPKFVEYTVWIQNPEPHLQCAYNVLYNQLSTMVI